MRLIDADVLMERIRNRDRTNFEMLHCSVPIEEIYKIILDMETTELPNYAMGYQDGVRKVLSEKKKTGKWENDKVAFYLTCSECGCSVRCAEHVFLDDDNGYYYCPNCGAEMKGEEE